MKWISAALISALLVVSAGMVLVTKKGVSIRTAPYIKPTVIPHDKSAIAEHLYMRLFPELQQTQHWFISYNSNYSDILNKFHQLNETQLKRTIELIPINSFSLEALPKCSAYCWYITSENSSSEIAHLEFFKEFSLSVSDSYQTLSLTTFERDEVPTQQCLDQKILTPECVTSISVNEVRKKIKDPSAKYFFARKYLDRDIFIFIEE